MHIYINNNNNGIISGSHFHYIHKSLKKVFEWLTIETLKNAIGVSSDFYHIHVAYLL